MIILNNIQLISIIDKVMESLKKMNGFDDLIYGMLDGKGTYTDFLKEVEGDVIKSMIKSKHLIMEVIDR